MKVMPRVYYELKGYSNYYAIFDDEGKPNIVSFKNFNKYPTGYILKRYIKGGTYYWKLSSDSGELFEISITEIIGILGNYFSSIPNVMERRKIKVDNGIVGTQISSKSNKKYEYTGKKLCSYEGPLIP